MRYGAMDLKDCGYRGVVGTRFRVHARMAFNALMGCIPHVASPIALPSS